MQPFCLLNYPSLNEVRNWKYRHMPGFSLWILTAQPCNKGKEMRREGKVASSLTVGNWDTVDLSSTPNLSMFVTDGFRILNSE